MTPKRHTAKPRSVKAQAKRPTGDCYEAAGKHIMSQMDDNLMLVHGEVRGQGPLAGVNFGHAWLVDTSTDSVLDKSNGRDINMPRFIYYAIGGIEEIGNFHEYTRDEAREKMLKYGHYGPWDLKTSTGL